MTKKKTEPHRYFAWFEVTKNQRPNCKVCFLCSTGWMQYTFARVKVVICWYLPNTNTKFASYDLHPSVIIWFIVKNSMFVYCDISNILLKLYVLLFLNYEFKILWLIRTSLHLSLHIQLYIVNVSDELLLKWISRSKT